GVDRVHAPEGENGEYAADDRPPTTGNAALELVATAIENVLEIGRISARTARAAATSTRCLAPGTASIAATSASIILPRHLFPFGSVEKSFQPYIGKRPVRSMR